LNGEYGQISSNASEYFGKVGHYLGYTNTDPGNDDYFFLRYNTKVGVWYWLPRSPARLEVWIKARCGAAENQQYSDSTVGFNSHLEMHIENWWDVTIQKGNVNSNLFDGVQLLWASHTVRDVTGYFFGLNRMGGDPQSVQNIRFRPNEVVWLHFVTSPLITHLTGGSWVLFTVGFDSTHTYLTNDFKVIQRFWNLWDIDEIKIRTV